MVAIGGGEIRRKETLPLDAHIVGVAGRTRPLALFIPTASDDSLDYWDAFQQVYGGHFGCFTDVLFLVREKPSAAAAARKIEQADILYVGGGNTRRMLAVWRRAGIDRMLGDAARRGAVLAGLSAGAMCWFRYGGSDFPVLDGTGRAGAKLGRVTGLGMVDAMLCPHMDSEPFRWLELHALIRRTTGICLALDDHCAVEIRDDTYRILACRAGAAAHRLFLQDGRMRCDALAVGPIEGPAVNFHPLTQLTKP